MYTDPETALATQMHNTCFVFQPILLTTLVLLPVATVGTSVRVLVVAFRHFGSNAELLTLADFGTLLGQPAGASTCLHH